MRKLRNCSSCNKITQPRIFLRRPEIRSLRNYYCYDSSSSYCYYYYYSLLHHHHHPLYAEILGCTKNKQTQQKEKEKKLQSVSHTCSLLYKGSMHACMHTRQQSINQQLCCVACIIIIITIIVI